MATMRHPGSAKWSPPAMDTAWDASRLRRAWERADVSPTQAAAACGVTAETLRRWRLGVNVPDAVQLRTLARLLGTDILEVLPPE